MKRNDPAIGSELEKCRKDGLIRPEDVVKRARNAKSPLHDHFTWDNSEAARQWRLIEARNLIRVHVVQAAEDIEPIQAFVSLTSDRVRPGGGYRALTDVMNDAELYNQMRQDAFTQLQNMQLKYRRIVELEPVWKAFDHAKRKSLDDAA
jgi:hypothetical protein